MRSRRSRLVLWGAILVVALGAGLFVHYDTGPDDTAGATVPASVRPTTTTPPGTTESPLPGRYRTPPDCAALTGDSLTFQTVRPVSQWPGYREEQCQTAPPSQGSHVRIWVTPQVYADPADVSGAASNATSDEPLNETGFENPPTLHCLEEECSIDYVRSNESVSIGVELPGLGASPGGGTEWLSAAMPYVRELYQRIG